MSLLEQLLRHRHLVLLGYLVLLSVTVPGMARLESDNSPEVFFVRDDDALAEYRDLTRDFGNDQAVRLVVEGEGIRSDAGRAWLRQVEDEAQAVPGVDRLVGPRDPGTVPDPLELELGLTSHDGTAVTVLMTLQPQLPAKRRATLERLASLAATAPPGVDAHLSGLPAINRELDRSAEEIPRRFFPLLVGLAIVLLAVTLRGFGDVAMPLLFVGTVEGLLLGTMGYAGVRLNLVLAILPPLVFAIALATAVHLSIRFRDFASPLSPGEKGSKNVEAVLATWGDKGWAVLWTGLTTLVGFASLAASQLPPVRSLGLWTGLGMAILTVAAFTLYPALLASLPRREKEAPRFFERTLRELGGRWAMASARHRGRLLAVAATVAAVALAGTTRLDVESNALHYLDAGHPLRGGVERLEALGIGVAAVECVLIREIDEDDPDPEAFLGFQGLAALGQLAELSAELRTLDAVFGVVGAGDLVEAAARASVPEGAEIDYTVRGMALTTLRLERESRERFLAFVTEEGERARLVVFTPMTSFDRLEPLLAAIRQHATARFPTAEVVLTGEYPLLLAAQRGLLLTLGLSLGLTFLAVALIFRTLLPSTRLTLLALVPNLWPVVLVLGVMGWLGVRLDVATVMVAAIVLGLAVDDTIHTLGHFRELAPERGRFAAVAATLERTAAAYVLTGVILATGFGVCGFSSFAPTARFGVLAAGAVTAAVVADLFLLPALMSSTPRAVVERLRRDA